MKNVQKLTSALAIAAMIAGIGMANAADKAGYEKAHAATMAEIKQLEKEGIAPWNPTAKEDVLKPADDLAKKGDYEGAIKYADRIASMQKIAVKEWNSQPNPGPYTP
jgi:predicted metal-dependent phosphoesterase TrpH